MPIPARRCFGHGDAFVLGLVRQHRAGNHIADRPDAIDLVRKS
jgi:hypothetical protein